jgi:hypothetical protein
MLLSSALAAQVQHGGLTVTYADARDARQLGTVFRAWDTATADLSRLGLTVPAHVRIRAALNAAQFASATGESAGIAAITRGATIHTQRLGALAARGLLPLTIRHEAFHTAQPPGLPRWLAEGLARTFSGEGARDQAGTTGLESMSSGELDAALRDRRPGRLSLAYLEATRRAATRLKAVGWKGVFAKGR